MTMMQAADIPCATRSQPGTTFGAGWTGDLLSASATTTRAAAHAAIQYQVSGIGEDSIKSTTPRNTKIGGAATASRAMYFALRCAAVGRSIAANEIAIIKAKIGA